MKAGTFLPWHFPSLNSGTVTGSTEELSCPREGTRKKRVDCSPQVLASTCMKKAHVTVNKGASLVAQTVKRLPTMRETWVQFLGREDPLEKEMAPHSSTLAWKSPWTKEPGRLRSMGSQSQTRLSDFTFT